jgi:hypothetical protein
MKLATDSRPPTKPIGRDDVGALVLLGVTR